MSSFSVCMLVSTSDRRQSKTLILLTDVDQKSIKTEFSIAICCPTGDKWQSKTLFLAIFDQCSSIVKSVFDCRLSGVVSQCVTSRQIRCVKLALDCSRFIMYLRYYRSQTLRKRFNSLHAG